MVLSADSGEMQIRFISDALEASTGFSAVFSADCPNLEPGEGKIRAFTSDLMGSNQIPAKKLI